MKTKMNSKRPLAVFLVTVAVVFAFGFKGGMEGSSNNREVSTPKLGKLSGDAYRFFINNIDMPMNSAGILADVSIGGRSLGRIDGVGFLYSGGFFMSGKNPNGSVWANAMASASRIQDYLPGRAQSQSTDKPVIYVVDGDSPAFGQDWQDWKDAVAMGADFYDGNKNGIYDPIDLNGNGKWEPNEDRPDLLGDHTAWCVYTDSKPSAQRTYSDMTSRGIDIRQTVFGFKSAGLLGNILFVRYRITNTGTVAARYDSVYFGVWADSDLGDSGDDLVGCDTLRNAGFTYNDGSDPQFGPNPPCYLVDFFQGPIAYVPGETFTDVNGNGVYNPGVDVPLTTAYNYRGPVIGVDTVRGAKNLGLSSFVNYVQSNPDRGDPGRASEARGYNTGRLKTGGRLDPCNDAFGAVQQIPCTAVNPQFWYSGDPTNGPTGYGWIYGIPSDMRQMQNVGPFVLESGKAVDIVVAMVVGRGIDAKNSITVAKNTDDFAQFLYNQNFESPPPPPIARPIIRTTDNTIELIWDTYEQMTNRVLKVETFPGGRRDTVYDMQFQGYIVSMYNSPTSTASTEGGRENAKVIARLDKADQISNVLIEKGNGERSVLFPVGDSLNIATYSNPATGRLRLVIATDPFTNGPLIKGRPYFISISGYALNDRALTRLRPGTGPGDFLIPSTAFITYTQNPPLVLNGGIIPGSDFNNPIRSNELANQTAGLSEGKVYFDEVSRDSLTGHKYEVSFFKSNAAGTPYAVSWKLKDATLNTVKADSQSIFIDSLNYAVKLLDGLRVRVVNVAPVVKTPTYSAATRWYRIVGTVPFFTGADVNQTTSFSRGSTRSRLKTATDMRQFEIRFGPTQKAYRYVNGLPPTGAGRFEYAANMPRVHPDTLSPLFRKGYVDVPFQVWVKDPKYGVERQMNCGFMETRLYGSPNGIWDPGTNVDEQGNPSGEFIIVFDTPYAPDTSLVYTGGSFNGSTRWANILNGWAKPAAWPAGILSSEDSARAADQWLSALYVVPLARQRNTAGTDSLWFNPGEILTTPISYPFTSKDVFTYQSTPRGGSVLTTVDRKKTFEKVNVFPNPLFAYNPGGSYTGTNPDDPYVTFSNLPPDVSVRIYSLSGVLLRTLTKTDPSPFLRWNLQNEAGLRVASGMYLAIVSAQGIGEKVLKFAIIMPQKQIQRY